MNLKWIKKLVGWWLSSPASEEVKQLAEIKEQMEFWHREEDRTLQNAIDAMRREDWDQYEIFRQQHRAASLRCKAEVTDKLRSQTK